MVISLLVGGAPVSFYRPWAAAGMMSEIDGVERLHAIRAKHEPTLLLVEQNLEFIRGLSERIFTIQKSVIARELYPSQLDDHDLTTEFAGVWPAVPVSRTGCAARSGRQHRQRR